MFSGSLVFLKLESVDTEELAKEIDKLFEKSKNAVHLFFTSHKNYEQVVTCLYREYAFYFKCTLKNQKNATHLQSFVNI